MNELEKAILCLIEKCYEKKYIGNIKVTKLDTGYNLVLGMNVPEKLSILIACDCDTPEQFLKFIEKELNSRLLIKFLWFRGIKIHE